MASIRKIFNTFLFFLFFAAFIGLVYVFFYDTKGPQIALSPKTERVSPLQELSVTLEDGTSGVSSMLIMVRRGTQNVTIMERRFPDKPKTVTIPFNLRETGLRNGQFVLEVKGNDGSLAGFGRGNSNTQTWNMTIDSQPPRVSITTPPPNVRKGGAALIAYTVSEPVSRSGIRLGDRFFPGYKQKDGNFICVFPFPYDMTVQRFLPEIIAEDLAGNMTANRLALYAIDKKFREDTLNISDNFLNAKSADFETISPEVEGGDLARYLHINKKVRIDNEKLLFELGQKSSPEKMWKGTFARLPRAATRATFGDFRTYTYNNTTIDEQTHMGLDLASTAHADIPAANNGIIVFAAPLGIFGKLVLIDHGMGVMSLYSHMNEIIVKPGDAVKKGQTIGQTGKTGLAGGDHLHFGVLINGLQSQPVEWFDPQWLKNNIEDRMK